MADLYDLAARVIAGPARLGDVRLVTVDGPSGSGKSTAGRLLRDAVVALGKSVALVPTDHFATWTDPFGWWPTLESGVLQPLSIGQPARYVACSWIGGSPVFDRPITVAVPDVLVLEGVSASRQAVADRTTLAVWVEHSDRAARLGRVVARDGESVRGPLTAWQDAEDGWFAADGTRERADVVLTQMYT